MQSYSIKQNFVAVDKQQVFKLNKPFVRGTINVYLNGALQTLDSDYTEMPDNARVTFTKELTEGDVIAVTTNDTVEAIKVMSFGKRDTTNALYQKYSSVEKLKFNNKYNIRIVIDDTPVEWSFVTQLTPFMTTVRKINEDIGEFIQGFTDEYIASMIHRNSWELIQRIQEAADDPDASENLNDNATVVTEYNSQNGEFQNEYRAANNWVRFKTEIDLIYARYFGISFNYGEKTKTIGDITVSKSTKLPYIDNLLDRLKDDLEEEEQKIFGSINFVQSYQKGSTKYKYEDIARKVSWTE